MFYMFVGPSLEVGFGGEVSPMYTGTPPVQAALWHVPFSLSLWVVSVFLLVQGIASSSG
jgi:hypothetical protein